MNQLFDYLLFTAKVCHIMSYCVTSLGSAKWSIFNQMQYCKAETVLPKTDADPAVFGITKL